MAKRKYDRSIVFREVRCSFSERFHGGGRLFQRAGADCCKDRSDILRVTTPVSKCIHISGACTPVPKFTPVSGARDLRPISVTPVSK